MELTVTLVIVIATCLVSFAAFSNQQLINDLIFYPPAITERNQWYRFFTCGFIHADAGHLIFNMLSLYLFGEYVEQSFDSLYGINESGYSEMLTLFGDKGKLIYVAMYILALFFCLLPTFSKHKNDYHYRSLGASGAVSAVVFAGILLEPNVKIGLFFIPPIIPGYIFGPLYLIISSVLEKRSSDNINHSAHIWGALFGIAFIIVTAVLMKTEYHPLEQFIRQIKFALNL